MQRQATSEGRSAPAQHGNRDEAARRIGGIAALAFVLGVILANGAMFGGPTPNLSAEEAAAWYASDGGRAMFAVAMVALTFPALLIFGGAIFELSRTNAGARIWSLVGALGGAAMVGVFSIVGSAQVAAVLLAEAGGPGFEVTWLIHNGAFAVNMSILGTAFLGFALAAHGAGVSPRWHRTLGVIGALLLLVTGFANAWVAAGSPIVFIGFGGFLLWLAWLSILGVRLLADSAPG